MDGASHQLVYLQHRLKVARGVMQMLRHQLRVCFSRAFHPQSSRSSCFYTQLPSLDVSGLSPGQQAAIEVHDVKRISHIVCDHVGSTVLLHAFPHCPQY